MNAPFRRGAAPWVLRIAGLLVCPALTALAARSFPGVAVSEAAAASIAYGCGAGSALASLGLAATKDAKLDAIVAAAGVALVVAGALVGAGSLAAVLLVNLGLVAAANGLGSAIGRRVVHAGHLLPACAVAAAADVASVLHPSGPSHAIASSDRALSLLAIAFPVPGAAAVAPVLGAGDLVFLALAFAAAVAHGVSVARVVAAAAVGLALAGGLAAATHHEIPALVTIGAALVAFVPAFRQVRREDRRTATLAVGAAVAVVVGVLVSPRPDR